jgi:hypothetical protein
MATEGPKLLSLALDCRREIDGLGSVFLTADHLIDHNLSERQRDSGTGYAFQDWWRTYVIVGTNGSGDFYCLRLDETPGVWMIGSDCGDEPTRTHPRLRELVAQQLEWYREQMTDPELVVSVACLSIDDWEALKKALPDSSDLGNDFWEFTRDEDERFAHLERAGKKPRRVIVPVAEFLAWCSSNRRSPDAASREAFAAERLLIEHPWVRKQRG